MSLRAHIAVFAAKVTSLCIKFLGLGAGATWPGEIALTIAPDINSSFARQLKQGCALIAGTNGKTTTSLMLTKILEHAGNRVVHNASGANLLNGVVSSFIAASDWRGNINADYGVFEVDENSLPAVLKQINTNLTIVLLNLFRDQLDRYGEVDVIAEKWERALREQHKQGQQESNTSKKNTMQLIVNADDPGVAHLGRGWGGRITYYGLNEPALFLKTKEHATDSTFCLHCGNRLTYDGVYYSHIGIWKCKKCGEKRPKPTVTSWESPLPGLYNRYNTLAAVAAAQAVGIADKKIKQALVGFAPAFGRQEEFVVGGKTVKIFLSKNPAGFNASLRTVLEMKPKILLLVLNDRIPDGKDVSWIWDVDFELIPADVRIVVSGDRVYDMAVRIKYSLKSKISSKLKIEPNLQKAIHGVLDELNGGETLYVLPTYSAMLEVRKILTGRKIL